MHFVHCTNKTAARQKKEAVRLLPNMSCICLRTGPIIVSEAVPAQRPIIIPLAAYEESSAARSTRFRRNPLLQHAYETI